MEKVLQSDAYSILFHYFIPFLCFHLMQITIDNCVEVEHIAKDLLLEDLQLNIGDC